MTSLPPIRLCVECVMVNLVCRPYFEGPPIDSTQPRYWNAPIIVGGFLMLSGSCDRPRDTWKAAREPREPSQPQRPERPARNPEPAHVPDRDRPGRTNDSPGREIRENTDPVPSPGSVASATPLEAITISCLTNAHYHSGREAFLDTVHRWFMFMVIALGATALTDVFPRISHSVFGLSLDIGAVKEACAASAAIIAALDLTFDLSNRARSHSMMKRRYSSTGQS